MNQQERQLVSDLFDRLSKLEGAPRDADAERAIADGLRRAPNALYPLVQTVLVQDEALRRADARIRELSGEEPQQSGGFLDSMRSMFTGSPSGGSVPAVRQRVAEETGSRWNQGAAAPQQAPQPAFGGGSSFLGTAAATAAGVIGGALLMNSFRSMFGGQHNPATAYDQNAASPWNGGSDADTREKFSDLNNVDMNDQRAGLFDSSDSDFSDGGGFDGGGSDA